MGGLGLTGIAKKEYSKDVKKQKKILYSLIPVMVHRTILRFFMVVTKIELLTKDIIGGAVFIEKKILAVLDEEEAYVRRLTGYFNYDSEFGFQAVAFTNLKSYQMFAKDHAIECLLCTRSFYEEVTEDLCTGQVCLLSDREEVCGKSKSIFKYQSAEDMKKEIQKLCQRKEDSLNESSSLKKSRVLGFLSPAGGCFCSTLAMAAALLFAEHDRTVFVSFDPFLAANTLGITVEQSRITEAIYLLRHGGETETKIAELAGHAGRLDYYAGCLHWADLTEIEPEEIKEFLSILTQRLGYQTVIIDGGLICRASAGLLSSCQIVYEPFFGTAAEEEKQREWLRQCHMNDPQISKKLQRIRPPYDEKLADGLKEQKDLMEGVLGSFIKDLFFNGAEKG